MHNLSVKMNFICVKMKNHFHIKGWLFNLVLIQRPGRYSEMAYSPTNKKHYCFLSVILSLISLLDIKLKMLFHVVLGPVARSMVRVNQRLIP